jgi:methylenetetrahydrofolate reductase (NADPH)
MTAHLPPRRPAWLGEALPPVELSFEFFPPKSPAQREKLEATIERLKPLAPDFVSVTCGAGGGKHTGTAELVGDLRRHHGLAAAAHLTCAGASRALLDEAAQHYWEEGVTHLIALRGDPPRDSGRYLPHPDGYPYAADLVAALRRIAPFEISVACYPETHPEASSPQADLDNLKRKVDAGAGRAISQYCFDTDAILRFRDRMAAAGIAVPLAAGIIPVHDFQQIRRFSLGCGAGVPGWLARLFEGLEDDPETRAMVAASVAAEQCRRLVAEGVERLHVYTLNRAEITVALCRLLGQGARLARAA